MFGKIVKGCVISLAGLGIANVLMTQGVHPGIALILIILSFLFALQ